MVNTKYMNIRQLMYEYNNLPVRINAITADVMRSMNMYGNTVGRNNALHTRLGVLLNEREMLTKRHNAVCRELLRRKR